jgi:hypothetical protein
MGLPIGKQYSATVAGSEIRTVQCANCNCEYVYVVEATGSATAISPLYINQDAAESRARVEARAAMKRQLKGKIEAVACPACGNYQPDMVRFLRHRRLRRGLLIAAIPLVWVALKWCYTAAETPEQLRLVFWGSISAGLAVVAFIATKAFDDNLDAPNRAKTSNHPAVGMRKAEFEALQQRITEIDGLIEKQRPNCGEAKL